MDREIDAPLDDVTTKRYPCLAVIPVQCEVLPGTGCEKARLSIGEKLVSSFCASDLSTTDDEWFLFSAVIKSIFAPDPNQGLSRSYTDSECRP